MASNKKGFVRGPLFIGGITLILIKFVYTLFNLMNNKIQLNQHIFDIYNILFDFIVYTIYDSLRKLINAKPNHQPQNWGETES